MVKANFGFGGEFLIRQRVTKHATYRAHFDGIYLFHNGFTLSIP